jgi:3-oxoacyl-[acyl-carrier protein] reductase
LGREVTTARAAIITGASSGIGLATAQAFLADGWQVACVSRRRCPESAVMSVEADLLAPGGAKAAAVALRAWLPAGATVSLVHNAAKLVTDSAFAVDSEAFVSTLQLQVVVPAQLNTLLGSAFSPGSSILYVGSTLSLKGVAGFTSYVTSKHAVVGLMRATSQDGGPRQVHSACILPGLTQTEMLDMRAKGGGVDLAALEKKNLFGRLVQPSEVASVIVFCATNPTVNGAVIRADLGQVET